MEEKGLVLCDSDIMIEVFDRNNQRVIAQLGIFGTENLCISSVTFSEIVIGAKSKEHQLKLISSLQKFILFPLDVSIDKTHRDLITRYSLSHGLQIRDALIASTSLTFEIPLFTLNTKDFRFIKGIKLL